MSSDFDTELGPETEMDNSAFRDADDRISSLWLERLRAFLAAQRGEDVALVMEPLHTADVGDVLELLDHDERLALVRLLVTGSIIRP
jgi:magnesium transporter